MVAKITTKKTRLIFDGIWNGVFRDIKTTVGAGLYLNLESESQIRTNLEQFHASWQNGCVLTFCPNIDVEPMSQKNR